MAIIVGANSKDVNIAYLVADHVELLDVSLSRAVVENNLALHKMGRRIRGQVDLKYAVHGFSLPGPERLKVDASVIVDIRVHDVEPEENESEEEKPQVRIIVSLSALYTIPPGPIPEDIKEKGFPAFSNIVGLFNCWPYFRQEVDHLACSIGIPVTLPILRLSVTKDKKETKRKVAKPLKTKKAKSYRGKKKKPPSSRKAGKTKKAKRRKKKKT